MEGGAIMKSAETMGNIIENTMMEIEIVENATNEALLIIRRKSQRT